MDKHVGDNVPLMSNVGFLPFAYIAVLLLAGVTALYYSFHNPITRFRNTLLSLLLLSVACYQLMAVI
jgi:hypothetical protein